MVTIFKGRASLQFKFGVSYIIIIAAVLVLMNSYPLLVSQNLVFRSKESSMSASAKLVGASLSGLAELTEENVTQALSDLRQTGVSRVLVTNTLGQVLYDTQHSDDESETYTPETELTQALDGYDAFFCRYDAEAFHSRFASPVVYRGRIVGAVYAYDFDTEQARLLQSLQNNLLVISGIVAVLVLALSVILSRVLTRRISDLLQSIRQVRRGAYNHRAHVRGSDEISQIAAEFNRLTDRLQTTDASRRRFVSDASHELKTPLAGIRLMTDSILQTDDMDADTVREFVSDIAQETERLSRITEDLLHLTRLDNGAVSPAGRVEIAPVLERVERMLGAVARDKGITLDCRVEADAVVWATEDEIHQILYNMMENGVKYSRTGGFVHTSVRRDGQHVVIDVEDNGIGIPDEDMPHVFDRFYRVDKMRSRQIGGTGLGLSIVHDTVVRRGGTVEVRHRDGGEGTVFTVRLPLYEEGSTS